MDRRIVISGAERERRFRSVDNGRATPKVCAPCLARKLQLRERVAGLHQPCCILVIVIIIIVVNCRTKAHGNKNGGKNASTRQRRVHPEAAPAPRSSRRELLCQKAAGGNEARGPQAPFIDIDDDVRRHRLLRQPRQRRRLLRSTARGRSRTGLVFGSWRNLFGSQQSSCMAYDECYVDVCDESCKTCDAAKLSHYTNSDEGAFCDGDAANCYSNYSTSVDCRAQPDAKCNTFAACEANPCGGCDPFDMKENVDFQCQDLRDEVVDFAEQGGFCGANGVQGCFSKAELPDQQTCADQDVYGCEEYSACEVALQEKTDGTCSLTCSAYNAAGAETCEDQCNALEWDGVLEQGAQGARAAAVERCKRRCAIVASVANLKQETLELRSKTQNEAFRATADDKVQRLLDFEAYLLARLNVTASNRTQLLQDLGLSSLVADTRSCETSTATLIPTAALRTVAQTKEGLINLVHAMLVETSTASSSSSSSAYTYTVGDVASAALSLSNCYTAVYSRVLKKLTDYAAANLPVKRKLAVQRDVRTARLGGYMSVGSLQLNFCLKDNLNTEDFFLVQPRPHTIDPATRSWAGLPATDTETQFPCPPDAPHKVSTFYDAMVGIDNVANEHRFNHNSLMLTQGSQQVSMENHYDLCIDTLAGTNLARLPVKAACSAAAASSSSSSSGDQRRRLLSTPQGSASTVIVTSTNHRGNHISGMEHTKCPPGSKRAKWPHSVASSTDISSMAPVGYFACWNAWNDTSLYFTSEAALQQSGKCVHTPYYSVSALETVDTKVCPNGLVVSKNSACLSSRYTYYSPSGGGVGATLIQFRPTACQTAPPRLPRCFTRSKRQRPLPTS